MSTADPFDRNVKRNGLHAISRKRQRRSATRCAEDSTKSILPELCSLLTKQASTGLQINEVSLIAVVQSLGQYINDEDDKIRGRAVSYLTSILEALPPKHLSRQQIQVLCQFFCDRIEDAGAIDGLSRLQSLERFNNDMAQTAVRA